MEDHIAPYIYISYMFKLNTYVPLSYPKYNLYILQIIRKPNIRNLSGSSQLIATVEKVIFKK